MSNGLVCREILDKIQAAKANFASRLPEGMTVDRFIAGISSAIQKNPALLDCDPNSVLLAAYEAAELGISLSPSLQLSWIIPYGKQAQFQPSYRAFIQKAYETGAFQPGGIVAEVVYSRDRFERQYAPKKNLFHAPPSEGERGEIIGAYCLVTYIDGSIDYEFMTTEQIERRRKHSKNPDSIMWTKFKEEGYRKTPIRNMAKRWPMKSEAMERLTEAIYTDMMKDEDEPSAPGTIELDAASPLKHEPAGIPAAVIPPEIPRITYCVGLEQTVVRGQVLALKDALKELGGKPHDGGWRIPASQTDALVKACVEKNIFCDEVDLGGNVLGPVEPGEGLFAGKA
jgi:recombination protein RecT